MKTNRKGKWLQIIIPEEWNQLTIEDILRNQWQMPKKMLHQFRMEKSVMINGERINWNIALQAGSQLEILLFKEEDFGVVPQDLSIDVLFEDDHLLVVNKPAGIDTHPNQDGQLNTLANGVAYYFQQKGEAVRVRHIHRLDKDTSGTILFAKHALSHALLDRLLNERKIKRTYLALVQGILPKKSAVIDQPIGRDRHHPTRRRVSPSGQNARTRYQVLNVFPKSRLTLIECSLDTGRTHQIRVHLSWTGHPLAGDLLYGGKPIFKRQALHARQLTFPHPITGEQVNCTASYNDSPEIFEKYLID